MSFLYHDFHSPTWIGFFSFSSLVLSQKCLTFFFSFFFQADLLTNITIFKEYDDSIPNHPLLKKEKGKKVTKKDNLSPFSSILMIIMFHLEKVFRFLFHFLIPIYFRPPSKFPPSHPPSLSSSLREMKNLTRNFWWEFWMFCWLCGHLPLILMLFGC